MKSKIINNDCLIALKEMEDNSIDSIVSDPPYGISFMGKKWDYDVPSVEVWQECLRVLKPGGHALIACGTRTQHRMAVNLEDAGFEIRDVVSYIYGSGFPKSRNIGKDIEKIKVGGIKNLKKIGTKQGIKVETGTQGFSYNKEYVAGKCMGGKQISGEIPVYEINNDYEGWGTALKPSCEFWTLCKKPISEKTIASNVLKFGTGGINIDGCRVGSEKIQVNTDFKEDKQSDGWGTKKCITEEKTQGRFPANLIHDGSEEVVSKFPDTGKSGIAIRRNGNNAKGIFPVSIKKGSADVGFNDSGSASRFFYCAKASESERNRGSDGFEEKERVRQGLVGEKNNTFSFNSHPTVKPLSLCRYLCRLITPVGGTILDPYMGSGSTGIGAKLEGFDFIGIEREEDYCKIAEARINSWEEDKQKPLL